jgi:WhiB family redox-sensing transcriptional regulator
MTYRQQAPAVKPVDEPWGLRINWVRRAACRGVPSELFEYQGVIEPAPLVVKLICEACPVRAACLAHAKVNREVDTWGGYSEPERDALRWRYGQPLPRLPRLDDERVDRQVRAWKRRAAERHLPPTREWAEVSFAYAVLHSTAAAASRFEVGVGLLHAAWDDHGLGRPFESRSVAA